MELEEALDFVTVDPEAQAEWVIPLLYVVLILSNKGSILWNCLMPMCTLFWLSKNLCFLMKEEVSDPNRLEPEGEGVGEAFWGIYYRGCCCCSYFCCSLFFIAVVVPVRGGGGVRWAGSGNIGGLPFFVRPSHVTPRLDGGGKVGEVGG